MGADAAGPLGVSLTLAFPPAVLQATNATVCPTGALGHQPPGLCGPSSATLSPSGSAVIDNGIGEVRQLSAFDFVVGPSSWLYTFARVECLGIADSCDEVEAGFLNPSDSIIDNSLLNTLARFFPASFSGGALRLSKRDALAGDALRLSKRDALAGGAHLDDTIGPNSGGVWILFLTLTPSGTVKVSPGPTATRMPASAPAPSTCCSSSRGARRVGSSSSPRWWTVRPARRRRSARTRARTARRRG